MTEPVIVCLGYAKCVSCLRRGPDHHVAESEWGLMCRWCRGVQTRIKRPRERRADGEG